MRGRTPRLLAAFLLCPLLPPGLAAQIDYRNLDDGRPSRVTDAVAVERYAFELSLPWRFSSGRGSSAHTLAPALEYGIARNLVVGVDLELVADRGGAGAPIGESHAGLSLFYNARRETPGAPALSFELEVGQPTAASLLSDLGATLTGIATRSLGRSRWHANLAARVGGPDAEPDGAAEPRWWAGLAWDYTLYRTSTLLVAELVAEDGPGETRWAVGAGVRRQLTPTVVLHAGLARRLDRGPGTTSVTLGLSHAFAVAGLMPGRRVP